MATFAEARRHGGARRVLVWTIAAVLLSGASMLATSQPAFASTVDTLYANQSLLAGESLVSADGRYTAVMQSDGNFVVYGPSGATWWTGSNGAGTADHIVMQSDGNLVAYTSAQVWTWSSGTAPSGNDRLVIQNDGNLVIYNGSNVALWANGSPIRYTVDTLYANQSLLAGQSLVSADGRYTAVMQSDGNFVVYGPSGATWWTGSNGAGTADHIVMQSDGNLVAYTSAQVWTWSSGTAPSSNDRLVIQNDGNLVIYNGSNTALWANGSPVGRTRGTTTTYNVGVAGYCTWGALDRWHQAYGDYPLLQGNAKDWAASATSHGWTVTQTPTVNSVVVEQPGVHGADPTYGHVAWVTSINGSSVTYDEMDGTNGLGAWDTRTVSNVAGMSYILAD